MEAQLLQPSPANAAVGTAAVVGSVSQRVVVGVAMGVQGTLVSVIRDTIIRRQCSR